MPEKKIPFNKPFLTGKEAHYLYQAVYSGKISGNGIFTQKCQRFFEQRYGFEKCLLTTSCTDALEMAALLLNVKSGDEVILPSYTFVSTANPFVQRGAKLVFADSRSDHPGIDESTVESLITKKTKVIVVVHYAGIATDMSIIMALAKKYGLFVVEDAAQAIDGYYLEKKRVPLGSIGHLATFSFHETKNIISGEGGMLVINDEKFRDRAEIIWEKGTNRAAFFRGEIDKYGWVDVGSSFLPSEIVSSFLYAQLEHIDMIQQRRVHLWKLYYEFLGSDTSDHFDIPSIPSFSSVNGHIFYIVFKRPESRTKVISFLKERGIHAVFHYLSLHSSPYFTKLYEGTELKNTDRYSECLLRLPLFYELNENDVLKICRTIIECLTSE